MSKGAGLLRVKTEKGFTLVELLAALSVMSIFLLTVTSSFMQNMRHNLNSAIYYGAIQAGQKKLDELRHLDVTTITASTTNVPNGGRTYSVVVTLCETPTLCPSTKVKQINVDVNYKNELIYETETIFTEL